MKNTLAIETLLNAINDKVKKNWDDGTFVAHDIAVLIKLAIQCGLMDESQGVQLFHEANAGYLLTWSFLSDLGLIK